jgi:O-antigen ligase
MSGEHAGDWKGTLGHKNAFGHLAALATVVLAGSILSAKKHRFPATVGLVVCVTALVNSGSRSGIIAAAVAAIVLVAIVGLRPLSPRVRLATLWIAGALASVVLLLLWANPPAGLDLTLNKRTKIWVLAGEKIRERPLLGHGYAAFWQHRDGGPSLDIQRAFRSWYPMHGHNGFVDLTLDLGLLGLALLLIPFAFYSAGSYHLAMQGRCGRAAWSSAFLVFLAVANLAESELLRHNTIYWCLYVSTVTGVNRARNGL